MADDSIAEELAYRFLGLMHVLYFPGDDAPAETKVRAELWNLIVDASDAYLMGIPRLLEEIFGERGGVVWEGASTRSALDFLHEFRASAREALGRP